MEYNCFLCNGIAKLECVNARRYIRHGDNDDCINYAIARGDLEKLKRGDINSIKLDRKDLAEYLLSQGEKEKALEVLI